MALGFRCAQRGSRRWRPESRRVSGKQRAWVASWSACKETLHNLLPGARGWREVAWFTEVIARIGNQPDRGTAALQLLGRRSDPEPAASCLFGDAREHIIRIQGITPADPQGSFSCCWELPECGRRKIQVVLGVCRKAGGTHPSLPWSTVKSIACPGRRR